MVDREHICPTGPEVVLLVHLVQARYWQAVGGAVTREFMSRRGHFLPKGPLPECYPRATVDLFMGNHGRPVHLWTSRSLVDTPLKGMAFWSDPGSTPRCPRFEQRSSVNMCWTSQDPLLGALFAMQVFRKGHARDPHLVR